MQNIKLQLAIREATIAFREFKQTSLGADLFIPRMNFVDNLIMELSYQFNYVPMWIDEYNEICDLYFSPMRIKVREGFIKASEFTPCSN